MAQSQALGFGEILMGGVLVAAGMSGQSIRDVLAGRGSPLRPLASDFPTGSPGAGPVSIAGSGSGPAPTAGGAGGAAAQTQLASSGGASAGPHGKIVNPLPGWSQSRIDQGVDYYGGSAIHAPMAGTVLAVGAPGWPQGLSQSSNGVLLKLANGQIWYFYEGLVAKVHAGQQVVAGQLIASGLSGQSIEVGLADSNGVPLSHAGYYEGKVTNAGKRALQILKSWGV